VILDARLGADHFAIGVDQLTQLRSTISGDTMPKLKFSRILAIISVVLSSSAGRRNGLGEINRVPTSTKRP
jgi:hypothetical protein